MDPAFIALLLRFLPIAISAGGEIYALIQKIMEALKQNAELTPEQEKELDAYIAKLEAQPWWQPDPQL
jgi:hypothetical protein